MTATEFSFTVRVNDEPHFERMLTDLVSGILARSGVNAGAALDIVTSVRRALANHAADGHECCLRFESREGHLDVTVGYLGEREQLTRVALR